jgi:hypothetical protein
MSMSPGAMVERCLADGDPGILRPSCRGTGRATLPSRRTRPRLVGGWTPREQRALTTTGRGHLTPHSVMRQPTVIDPGRFRDLAAALVRLFSEAHVTLARIKARRHL